MRATVVVPTKERSTYLDVALTGLCAQAREHGADVVVVDDGPSDATRRVAERHGARYVAHTSTRGLNAARNTGLDTTTAELVCFVDDDVDAATGWLRALLDGARRNPEHDCFTGPIRARFDGYQPRFCGREGPPITFLDLGPEERDAPHAWGANLAVRRRGIERAGRFDETLELYGDEQEWQARLRAAGGRIRWLPDAALDHRRAGDDARVSSLARAARARGRAARREDVAAGSPPRIEGELRVLAGCLLHGPLRRCANGPILTAHTLGRIEELLRPTPRWSPDQFITGRSGEVGGRRGALRRAADRAIDIAETATGRRALLRAAAARQPPTRRILVVGIEKEDVPVTTEATRKELARSRHDVDVVIGPAGAGGKFENVNRLLAGRDLASYDWMIVADDDIGLKPGFLDGFIFLLERHGLRIAQPAQTLGSHAAWNVIRRRPFSAVRETSFVEIGPVTAFHRETFDVLLPFPPLRQAWGLDLHWGAIARERGWRIGVVDALPVRHDMRRIGVTYSADAAIAEARAFHATAPHLRRDEVRTLVTHRGWR